MSVDVADQRAAALRYANEIRKARAREKAFMKELGRERALGYAAHVVNHPRPSQVSWEVKSLLMNIPGWGIQRVRRVMGLAGVHRDVKLGALTERQRGVLSGILLNRSVTL